MNRLRTAGDWVGLRVDDLIDRRFDARPLALLRMAMGPILLLHLRPFVRDVRAGRYYRDSFNVEFAAWIPHPPRPLYAALVYVCVAAALCVSAGLFTRWATWCVWCLVTANLFLTKTHYHHNRAFLVIVLGGLALAQSGAVWSIDAWRARRAPPSVVPFWPILLVRIEVCVVYLSSGISKAFDEDWWDGTVTWGRVLEVRDRVEASVLPGWFVDALVARGFHTYAAKIIVLTELFIGIGLWFLRTRPYAVLTAVGFHIAIQVSASVQVFSILGIAALVLWWPLRRTGVQEATPPSREFAPQR